MIVVTHNSSQTKKLGSDFTRKIVRKRTKKALVLGLKGDLGGGKTTFLQGFAKGLEIKQKILSPTFLILKRFKLSNQRRWQFKNFYHFDCYRIQKPKEILNLGFREIISDPKNIVAIEWADKIQKIMLRNTIWIKFEFIDENKRKIKINYE
jgi:tRNA threonylcarbamoyladenosine biosynthesis protein TsaE